MSLFRTMGGSSNNNNFNNNRVKKDDIITQENIYSLLHRYPVATVLTLLKEVAQVADVKIDWNELVKKSATGITNAREYQMLWRHLAYRENLEENLDEGAEPLDNDSDLEFELEAHPPSSGYALSEAASCVKVMFASASLADVNLSSVVEAPLSINVPSGWSSSSDASETLQLQETNITVPVLVPKQPLCMSAVASVEVSDASELAGGTSRRKKKTWSKKEEAELLTAVQRNGEGNWANIIPEDFKGDGTTTQLPQKWPPIKKRKKNSGVGADSQLADIAASRRAFEFALGMDRSKSNYLNRGGVTNPNATTTVSNLTRSIGGEPSQAGSPSHHHHQGQDSEHMTSLKTRFTKTSTSPALTPDAMVKAAAVAAGARIATPSDAATLFKAAQSKNAVHIIPTGGHGGTHQAQSQLTRPSLPTALTNPRQTANESDSVKEKVCEEVIVVLGNIQPELVQTSVASVIFGIKQKLTDDQAHKESDLPGTENRSDKREDNKLIEWPVEEGRESN